MAQETSTFTIQREPLFNFYFEDLKTKKNKIFAKWARTPFLFQDGHICGQLSKKKHKVSNLITKKKHLKMLLVLIVSLFCEILKKLFIGKMLKSKPAKTEFVCLLHWRTSGSCCAGSGGGSPAAWTDGSSGAFEESASCDLLLKSQRWRGHDPTGRLAPNRAQDSQRRTVAWLEKANSFELCSFH